MDILLNFYVFNEEQVIIWLLKYSWRVLSKQHLIQYPGENYNYQLLNFPGVFLVKLIYRLEKTLHTIQYLGNFNTLIH